jgi:hypothetical protein
MVWGTPLCLGAPASYHHAGASPLRQYLRLLRNKLGPCKMQCGTDPLGFVVSHNLHRRHLTESQRGMVAERMANLSAHRPPCETSPTGLVKPAVTMRRAAEMLSVGESTVTRAKKIQRLGSPELVAAVESGAS